MKLIESPIQQIKEKLILMLKTNDIKGMREIVSTNYPVDIAEAIKDFEIKEVIIFLRFLSTQESAEIFTHLNNDLQEEIIIQYSSKEIRELFDEIYTDDIVNIIEELPANLVKKILKSTTPESRFEINKILHYDEDTAGSIMSVDYLKLDINQTVAQAITTIKKNKDETEDVNDFFVVDELNNLKGTINLKRIFFSKDSLKLSEVMDDRVIFAYTSTDQEEIINKFKKYDITTLPILNSQNELVGIITVDDVIDVIDEEATEDIHKMAGIKSKAVEDTYFKTSVWKMIKSRILSLIFILIFSTVTQIIISVFVGIYLNETPSDIDNWSSYYLISVLFTPLITVISSINLVASSQSSTMVTRSLILKEIQMKDWIRILWKEFRVGLIIATVVALLNVLRMMAVYAVQFEGNFYNTRLWSAIATLSIAIFLSIIFSKLISGILPILAKLCKLDPSWVIGPVAITIVETSSVIIFFSIGLIFF